MILLIYYGKRVMYLVNETTHSRAGGQRKKNMREKQKVSLVLLLGRQKHIWTQDTRTISALRSSSKKTGHSPQHHGSGWTPETCRERIPGSWCSPPPIRGCFPSESEARVPSSSSLPDTVTETITTNALFYTSVTNQSNSRLWRRDEDSPRGF